MFDVEYDDYYNATVTGMSAEQVFTGAIKYVVAESTPTVYFVTGHNELSLSSNFTTLESYLENNNYIVNELALPTAGAVPDDAEMLFFANPALDLYPAEIDMLDDYFYQGGKAIFLFDYNEHGVELPNFNTALEYFNLRINNDIVRSDDDSNHPASDQYTIFYTTNTNAVFTQRLPMVLINSRSVSVLQNVKEWITTTRLIFTTDKAASVPVAVGASETTGAQDIAVAVENSGGTGVSRVIAMGNASFCVDSAYGQYGDYYQTGLYMVLYSLQWMLGESADSVTIESKSFDSPTLTLSSAQALYINIGTLVVLPLIILGCGLFVFLRRRHL